MSEANGTNIILGELKEEINELKQEIADKTSAVADTAAVNYDKVKATLEAKTGEIISVVKPYVDEGKQKTQEAAEKACDTIKKNPLASVGIAFITGVLLAKLFDRR